MTDVPRGRYVWFDLLTTDTEAGVQFYTDLMGWGTAQWEGGEQPYTMWVNGETNVGGVMALPDEAKQAGATPHWLGYISTPDVDATVSAATDIGAQVHAPARDIPTVGRFAVMADPQGALFAVFSPIGDTPGHDGPWGRGEVSWHELATTDADAAFEFYSTLFGWQKTDTMDMGEAGMYQMYNRGEGSTMGGMYNKTKDMPGPPAWLFYISVDDVNASVEKVKASQGMVLNGPMKVPGGSGDMIAQCMDPQGATFAMHSSGGA